MRVRLFLSGDVMTGRGIDQILPHPSEPTLHEPVVVNAADYVALAEECAGPVPRNVDATYIWGEALAALDAAAPDLRIVNLETSITRSPHWVPKGINYRMHPENVGCLSAARLDGCVLANNHVLDWGREGLLETLRTLRAAGIAAVGAGGDAAEAWRPLAFPLTGEPGGARLLLYAVATRSSGVPASWAAGGHSPGIAFVPDLTEGSLVTITSRIAHFRGPGDRVVLSVHWGGNWGYRLSDAEVLFAHALVDRAGVDIVYGHSSHHPKALEVYAGKLVMYGAGDLINDYEGIYGHDVFRPDLGVLYLPTIDTDTGELVSLDLVPMRRRRFRLVHADADDSRFLAAMWTRQRLAPGTAVEAGPSGLRLRWDRTSARPTVAAGSAAGD